MDRRPRGFGLMPIFVGLAVLILLMSTLIPTTTQSRNEVKYSEILYLMQDGKVDEFYIDLNKGILELKLEAGTLEELGVKKEQSASAAQNALTSLLQQQPQTTTEDGTEVLRYKLPYPALFIEDFRKVVEEYNAEHPDDKIDYDMSQLKAEFPWEVVISLVMTAGMAGLLIFFMFSQGGGGKAMSVGRAKVKNLSDDQRKATFADVAGADEEKEELQEIVEFLKNPGKFNVLGARIPHGVLLVGPPGTGKTLLARACAGEAGVPFYSISGSDFVEMYVGVGASRVRDLFDKAKRTAPCIIFIDEIDAVGRQRGTGLGGGHDEREQTLNQLLVEMDGFGANEGVIVVAATNRSDVLDKALLRPGRFDRQVYVGLPDVKGREEILKVHTRKKPLAPDVDLKTIAKSTSGFAGADLENLVNEAALLAARRGRKAITKKEIEEASIKVIAGPEKKSRVVSDKEKRLTAYHEAGHAITHYCCETADPVHEISIIPRGMAGGYTMSLPEDDKSFVTKTQMSEQLVTLLGGRVAEKLVLEDISTGASNDLERATAISRAMVTRYGFSEKLGPVVYSNDPGETFLGRDLGHGRSYSEEVAGEIDTEVRSLLDGAFETATNILCDHMEQLHLVAKELIEREKLSGEEFEKLMKGGPLEKKESQTVAQQAEPAEKAEPAQQAEKGEPAEGATPVSSEDSNQSEELPKQEPEQLQ